MREQAIETIGEICFANSDCIFVGSDLGPDTLVELSKNRPESYMMEGICEQALIGMSAGLALEGFIPYFVTIATFLMRRPFEQILIDICLHNLPVRLIGFGGGLAYANLGPTHCAIDDFAIASLMPNMGILAPADPQECCALLEQTVKWPHPLYLRLGKGEEPVLFPSDTCFKIGEAIVLRSGAENGILIVSTGAISQQVNQSLNNITQNNLRFSHLHLGTLKPIDKDRLLFFARRARLVISVEEHLEQGGLGSMLSMLMIAEISPPPLLKCISLQNQFVSGYGTREEALERSGLSVYRLHKVFQSLADYI